MSNLFDGKDDDRWWANAVLNFASDSWDLYATGYHWAAQALAKEILSGELSRGNLDPMIYPIAFMYRHAVELRLKQLINKASRYLGHDPDLKTHHKLKHLETDLRKLIEEMEDQSLLESLDRRHSSLQQLILLDESSMVFRYPVDKNAVPHLAKRRGIHVGQLSEFMDELLNELKGFGYELDNWIEGMYYDQEARGHDDP